MAQPRVYLDWNATAPLLPAAREALVAALGSYGNPSSVHAEGRAARAAVEAARAEVAALAGGAPARVTFTSGGTEAVQLALTPGFVGADRRRADVLIVSAVEHACVLEGHRFPSDAVTTAPVDGDGVLDLAALEALLAGLGGRRPLLALQAANNETGALQPVRAAAALVHAAGGFLVCDAVQAAGRTACDFATLDADALAFSAHKIGGTKGVGALVVRDAGSHIEDVQMRGGGQERGLRAGTENVAGIVAFGVAAQYAAATAASEQRRLGALRDAMEKELIAACPDVTLFGVGAARLANTSAFAAPGLAASTALIGLDLDGFAVSSGSACSSGKVRASHVLKAMGVPDDLAAGAIRVSLGRDTQAQDVENFVAAFSRAAARMTTRRKSAA